jgi:hypothetical protein
MHRTQIDFIISSLIYNSAQVYAAGLEYPLLFRQTTTSKPDKIIEVAQDTGHISYYGYYITGISRSFILYENESVNFFPCIFGPRTSN